MHLHRPGRPAAPSRLSSPQTTARARTLAKPKRQSKCCITLRHVQCLTRLHNYVKKGRRVSKPSWFWWPYRYFRKKATIPNLSLSALRPFVVLESAKTRAAAFTRLLRRSLHVLHVWREAGQVDNACCFGENVVGVLHFLPKSGRYELARRTRPCSHGQIHSIATDWLVGCSMSVLEACKAPFQSQARPAGGRSATGTPEHTSTHALQRTAEQGCRPGPQLAEEYPAACPRSGG